MLKLTRNGCQTFYYNPIKDDYFYKDTEERVPDEDGIGVNTTVFRRSNSRRVETESPEETRIRRLKFEELKKSVQKRILDSRF